MSARARVDRIRAALVVTAVVLAILWGAAAFAVAMLVAPSNGVLAPVAAAAAVLVTLWTMRRIRSREAVALWVEEHAPSLRYALVTASEQPAHPDARALERAAAAPIAASVARTATRRFAWPIGVLAFAMVAAKVPAIRRPLSAVVPSRPSAEGRPVGADRLAPLTVRIDPPAYAGLPSRTLADPPSIAALVASRVTVEGPGTPEGLAARRGDSSLSLDDADGHWRARFAMPARAMALRLSDGARERIVVLVPRPDSAPVVTLLAPRRDTVLRAAAGTLQLRAESRDDFGLADTWLEYIVSSGEGENFTFKSGVIAREASRDDRGTVSGALSLAALHLKPGDIVHVRAVARDRNDASGPDTGVSETRTIRIARANEYDSVAVEGAPPPDADLGAISERMLIQRAEALERRRARISRAVLTDSSTRIARDQARLRKQVSRVIFARLGAGGESEESSADDSTPPRTPDEMMAAADSATNAGATALDFEGDETPVVAVNRTLLEAYDAMWEAERRLQVAEPGQALPFMRAALDAIQRARAAERLYLRGRAPGAVVDLARARLTGKRDDASSGARAPRAALDTTRARRAQRLDAALALLPRHRDAAIDSLQLLRIDAIEHDPALAAALGAALDSLHARNGGWPMMLIRARRAASAVPAPGTAGAWEGAW